MPLNYYKNCSISTFPIPFESFYKHTLIKERVRCEIIEGGKTALTSLNFSFKVRDQIPN